MSLDRRSRNRALKPIVTALDERALTSGGLNGHLAHWGDHAARLVAPHLHAARPAAHVVHTKSEPPQVTVQGRTFVLYTTPYGVNYEGAKAAVSKAVFHGKSNGRLAVLDTPEKYAAVLRTFGNAANGAWAGATRDSGSSSSPLYWINGKKVQSWAFLPGEPNNFKGKENRYELFIINGQLGGIDVSQNQVNFAYIGEFPA